MDARTETGTPGDTPVSVPGEHLQARPSPLQAYVDNAYLRVEGWLDKTALAALDVAQRLSEGASVGGGAAEIGVHHGRFFLALLAVAGGGARSLAIDIFGEQALNIDGSGLGSEEKFRANLRDYSTCAETVEILTADSLTLTQGRVAEIGARFAPFRYFSVDGGHTATHALSDILVAQELTANGGFIIVDDFFHPDWPGVTEGVFEYFATGSNARFVPVCNAAGKLFLVSLSYHQRYQASFAALLGEGRPNSSVKPVHMFGYDVVSFRLHPKDPIVSPG